MFKKETSLYGNNLFGIVKERLHLDADCKEKYGFTDEEYIFLSGLIYFKEQVKNVPDFKNGFNTNKKINLDTFCLTLFDVYYGAKYDLYNNPMADKQYILERFKLIKSIVLKYSEREYKKMFKI